MVRVKWAVAVAAAAVLGGVVRRRTAPAVPGICPHDLAACYFSPHFIGAKAMFQMHARALKDAAAARKADPADNPACNVAVTVFDPGLDDPLAFTSDAVVVDACAGEANCRTLVHLSGVHGVEGYAGSAIQTALLQTWTNGDSCPPNGTLVVLVHAVNAYGFYHGRRWNENGVDLNRNALLRSEPFEGLADRRRDVEDAYAEISSLLNPISWSEVTFWWRALSTVARKGFVATKRVLVSGQYSVPDGLWFGGTELQTCHEFVLELLAKVVGAPKDNFWWMSGLETILDDVFPRPRASPSAPIFLIDVHTGLGPPGVDTLMALGNKSSLDGVRNVFGESDGTFLYGDTASGAASGYDATIGDVPSGYIDRLGWTNARGLIQEFGTIPGLLVARALVRENAAWHHGDDAEKRDAARDVRDAFYVPTAAWQTSVVERVVRVAVQALEGLADGRLP